MSFVRTKSWSLTSTQHFRMPFARQATRFIGAEPTKTPTLVTTSWTSSRATASLAKTPRSCRRRYGYSWSICHLTSTILGITTPPKRCIWLYPATVCSNEKAAPTRGSPKVTHRFTKATSRMRWKPWVIQCFALSRGVMILKSRLF